MLENFLSVCVQAFSFFELLQSHSGTAQTLCTTGVKCRHDVGAESFAATEQFRLTGSTALSISGVQREIGLKPSTKSKLPTSRHPRAEECKQYHPETKWNCICRSNCRNLRVPRMNDELER